MKRIISDLPPLDKLFLSIPLVRDYYELNAGRIKRGLLLKLKSVGLLRPYAHAIWLCTYRCNFTCPYCEASAGDADPNELTTEQAFKMVNDLAEIKVKKLLISGGEVLVRKDIFKVMKYANSRGIKIGILSNGFLVKQMKEKLSEIDMFFYFSSIDGREDYHNEMRGRANSFNKVFESLDVMRDLGVKTRLINSVIHPGNYDDLEGLFNKISQSSATMWNLTPMAKVGRADGDFGYSLSGEQLRGLVSFIREKRKYFPVDVADSHSYLGFFEGAAIGRPHFASAGLTKLAIMPDGEVLGCNQIYDHSYTEGSVKTRSLKDIWENEFKRFRSKEYPEYCMGCEFIKQCQGGFWAEMEKEKKCLKEVWFNS